MGRVVATSIKLRGLKEWTLRAEQPPNDKQSLALVALSDTCHPTKKACCQAFRILFCDSAGI
eukprot:4128127-Amphidinium_carterae.1